METLRSKVIHFLSLSSSCHLYENVWFLFLWKQVKVHFNFLTFILYIFRVSFSFMKTFVCARIFFFPSVTTGKTSFPLLCCQDPFCKFCFTDGKILKEYSDKKKRKKIIFSWMKRKTASLQKMLLLSSLGFHNAAIYVNMFQLHPLVCCHTIIPTFIFIDMYIMLLIYKSFSNCSSLFLYIKLR